MGQRTYTADELADLEVLGTGDLADLFGMTQGQLSMRMLRDRNKPVPERLLPPPDRTLGACNLWFRTAELMALVDKVRAET